MNHRRLQPMALRVLVGLHVFTFLDKKPKTNVPFGERCYANRLPALTLSRGDTVMEKQGLTKNQIISELTRSEHGDLKKYLPIGQEAAIKEPEFLAHLIAWDAIKGQIRDAHVALPVVSLSVAPFPQDYVENSLAHLAQLKPREFLKAYRFALDVKTPWRGKQVKDLVTRYLRSLESNTGKWDRVALQHKRTLKELYALTHTKPSARANRVLFKSNYPPNSVFEVVAGLKDMKPAEAAGAIQDHRIPFLVAMGALGKNAKEVDLVLALIERMSPTELVTNTKSLEKLGIKTNPVLRAAFEEALTKASKSKRATLKTTRAAENIADEGLKAKLSGLQEKQLQALGAVEGNWLVLGDKSGSMTHAIEIAQQVSAILAKMVKGQVSLVFFDTTPRFFDVTGKSYDEIKKISRGVTADGGTSIGCGLRAAIDKKVEIDGIAVVSDAQENTTPYFVDQYKEFSKLYGKEVPVYLYRCDTSVRGYNDSDLASAMKRARLDIQEFDVNKKVDFYSLPNLVATMRTNRYGLVDEIFATPLLTLKDVLKED